MIRYKKPKRQRIKSRFVWATIRNTNEIDGFWVIEYKNGSKTWKQDSKIWNDEIGKMNHIIDGKVVNSSSNTFGPIRSIRAFRRRLRKWKNILPKDTKVLLANRYVGYSVYGKIK